MPGQGVTRRYISTSSSLSWIFVLENLRLAYSLSLMTSHLNYLSKVEGIVFATCPVWNAIS